MSKLLRGETGTNIVFKSRDALRKTRSGNPVGNHFDPATNTIHLMTGKGNTGRGVFFEEIQHALDQKFYNGFNSQVLQRGNERLHRGTFNRIANNPWFDLSHDEMMGFLNWKGGADASQIMDTVNRLP